MIDFGKLKQLRNNQPAYLSTINPENQSILSNWEAVNTALNESSKLVMFVDKLVKDCPDETREATRQSIFDYLKTIAAIKKVRVKRDRSKRYNSYNTSIPIQSLISISQQLQEIAAYLINLTKPGPYS